MIHLDLSLPICLFTPDFPTKSLHARLLAPNHITFPAHLILLDPISPIMMRTSHSAPNYVISSTPLLPRPSWAQISSSAPYSPTPSAYVPPSMRATKFHTHKKGKITVMCILI